MLIGFTCQHCKGRFEIESSAGGTRIACPLCGGKIDVPRARPGPDTTIGGFKILKLIGVGGMGEVYLARQLSLDRDVALKIFPPDWAADRERVQRFLNEVRLLARLEHPNIVTAYEAGEDDGVLFVAMAYVNGEPLDVLIEREGAMPEPRALQIVRKVALALAYAWNEHQLLHRDIKPSNILLDAHGEPRIADLGLSRRVERGAVETTDSEILGTPNYMSPEQVQGSAQMDCRSDMYSLGATLYHMLTGRLPFQADSIMETLRKQLSERLPDPRVFQPSISEPCVHLMEIMLAKDPALRHSTWEALISDLERVRAGRMPTRRPMIKGESNLVREKDEHALAEVRRLHLSAADLEKIHHSVSPTTQQRNELPLASVIAWVLALALGGVAVWLVIRHHELVRPPLNPPNSVETMPEERPEIPREEPNHNDVLIAEWRAIQEAIREHPDDFDPLISRLKTFVESCQGHPLYQEALTQIRALRERRRIAVEKTIAALEAEARPLVAQGHFDEVIRLVEEYSGPFAAETRPVRQELVAGFRRQKEASIAASIAEREAAARAILDRARDEICAAVLRQDATAVRAASERALPALREETYRAELARLVTAADRAVRLKEVVMESFRAEIGRFISITLASGVESWELRGVSNGRLQLRRQVGAGYMERLVSYDDLAASERFRRAGPEGAPETELMRGVIMFGQGRLDHARRHFEAAGPPLGPALIVYLDRMATQRQNAAARTALERVATLARVTLNGQSWNELASVVRRTGYSAAEVAAIRAALSAYQRDHAEAPLTKEAAELLSALENVSTIPREVDPSVIKAALERLREGPPALDRLNQAMTVKPEGIELVLLGNPQLANLSALAGLPIIRLNISGTAVTDLGPLKGLPLRSIDASGCPITSLEALAGAPLVNANFERCPIESIAPLRGAPLTEINLCQTRVRSLDALAGAPLKKILADRAAIESLDPLVGMPLEELSVQENRKITSIQALAGMPLRRLILADTVITDIKPLAGLPLRELNISGCIGVRDLTPLKGMPLESLTIRDSRVSDLSVLVGMPLKRLNAGNLLDLEDISPLKDLPLTHLWLDGTSVSNLSPLAGSKLIELDLRGTPVSDLTPLQKTPIEVLFLDGCPRLRNFALQPLLQMRRLSTVTLPSPEMRPVFLQRHSSLRQIGYEPGKLLPVAEFFAR